MTLRKTSTFALTLALIAGCASATSPKQTETGVPAAQPSPAPSASPAPKAGTRKAAGAGSTEVRCTLGKDERIIMLEADAPGCEVYYSKPGVPDPKVVATSRNGLGHCSSVVEKMRANLSQSGFTCK